MRHLLAFLLTIPLFSANAQKVYENMPEESFLIQSGIDQKVHEVLPCKAYVSIGRTLSRIRIKKENIPGVQVKGNNNSFYIRGNMSIPSVPVAIIKLKDKGKTLQAFYSEDLGKKFSIINCKATAVDRDKKIYSVRALNVMDEGFYAVLFKRANDKGNFNMSSGKSPTYQPMVFEILAAE